MSKEAVKAVVGFWIMAFSLIGYVATVLFATVHYQTIWFIAIGYVLPALGGGVYAISRHLYQEKLAELEYERRMKAAKERTEKVRTRLAFERKMGWRSNA